jgi:hypothetical protein
MTSFTSDFIIARIHDCDIFPTHIAGHFVSHNVETSASDTSTSAFLV